MPYSSRVADQTVKDYFDGKPEALEIFEIVADKIAATGPSDMTIGSQISFGRARKFGYGSRDYGPIPGNSTLLFEVELNSVQ